MGIFSKLKLGSLSPRKASRDAVALSNINDFPAYAVLCVTIPPTVRITLFRQMDTGSLTCAQIWVRAVLHTKGGPCMTIEFAQK